MDEVALPLHWSISHCLAHDGWVLNACCPFQVDEAVAHLLDAEIPMKRLLLLLEMARQDSPDKHISLAQWQKCLTDLSVL